MNIAIAPGLHVEADFATNGKESQNLITSLIYSRICSLWEISNACSGKLFFNVQTNSADIGVNVHGVLRRTSVQEIAQRIRVRACKATN